MDSKALCDDMSLNRVERLLGQEAVERLKQCRVILFGVGGVGSWTAEALVRSGIKNLTIVDADCVAASNINRQLMALHSTVNQPKVDVLKLRLLDIAPDASIEAVYGMYDESTAGDFDLSSFDYVIDAIDSLSNKALLILNATNTRAKFFSSMGAALKLDPTRVSVAEFWKVKGCPLAAALRNKFKRGGLKPHRKFKCVYSEELVPNAGNDVQDTSGAKSFNKVRINGALCHMTGIFGFTLAGLVIEDVVKRK